MEKRVSIVIPAFKEKFLTIAIQSVLQQTYSNFELIILNDNPASNINSIVSEFNDDRIVYLKNSENQGGKNLISVWNSLLEKAKGEFFVMFSDDDIMNKDFISEMISLSNIYPTVNIFHCRVKVIDESNTAKYFVPSSPAFETAIDFIWHRIKNYSQFFVPDFMVRTAALKQIGGFADIENAWASDDLTWFRLANNGGIAATSKVLCSWRESNYNISQVGNPISKLRAINNYHKLLKSFIENELIFDQDQQEIFNDLKMNLKKKLVTDFGNALKSSSPNSIPGIIRVIFLWIKNHKEFNIPFEGLMWGIFLLIKGFRNNK